MNTENAGAAVHPKFSVPLDAVVNLNGRSCRVDRRLRDLICFLDIETREPLHESDLSLAKLQAEGKFFIEHMPGDARLLSPPHPLNVGESAHTGNLRKLDYVQGCLKHPDFVRSKGAVWIIEEIALRRKEKPPGFSTVLHWIDLHHRYGETHGSAALADRHDRKGHYGNRLPDYQERAIQIGLEIYLKRTTKANAFASVIGEVIKMDRSGEIDKESLQPGNLTEEGKLKCPSRKTFERRCDAIPSVIRDAMRKGDSFARRHGRTFSTVPLPEVPLSEVEVDHCTLDILLVHPKGLILGRPDLVLFRDRATAMVLGYGLGFEQPSYTAFIAGLRHAMYPKELTRFPLVKSPWPAYGRITTLITDQGKHFVGGDIESAAMELGITLNPLPGRHPWLKGAIERFFGSLNTGLLHQLPGTTLSNAVERKDYEKLGQATLTIAQFETLLVYWICEVYHHEDQKGLGFIRGFGNESPMEAWNEKSANLITAVLPRPELFTALSGLVEYRVLGSNGFTVDHIVYESPKLASLLGDPKHRLGGKNGASIKYKITRDPQNLGQIHVLNHHRGGEVVEISACSAHRNYAEGLTLTEHQIICEEAKRRHGRKPTLEQVALAKAWLNEITTGILSTDKFKKVQRRMARWLEGVSARDLRSKIVTFSESGTDFLAPKPRKASQSKLRANTDGSSLQSTSTQISVPPIEAEDDLAEVRTKMNWSSSYE